MKIQEDDLRARGLIYLPFPAIVVSLQVDALNGEIWLDGRIH